ncbi:MAG: hypothetical protein ABH834_02070 [Candidatus Altiarchaeota archaeon]
MRKKNPILAAVLGFLVHPLGYFYVGRYWRGLAIFFLVPLILSPFMPESQFLFENETVNASVGNMTGLSETDTNQTSLFTEVYETYANNPSLIFLQVFISFVISLDCFFIARKINSDASGVEEEGDAKVRDEPSGTVTVMEGMYFPIGVDVSCPRCKIGLASVTEKCPNCNTVLKDASRRKKD